MKTMRPFSMFIALAVAATLLGQPARPQAASPASDAAPTTAPVFSEEAFRAHVRTLASDDFEGRGPSTTGEVKTLNYLERTFAQAGLEPGGDVMRNGKRAWTQRVNLRRSRIVGDASVTIRSSSGLSTWKQGDEIAIRAALTGQTSVTIKRAPIVFVGYGVVAPEKNWNDYKNVDVRGKIVVILMNDPDFETGEGRFGGKAMTWYGRSIYKFQEAALKGAAGVLLVHEDAAVGGYGWATTRNSNINDVFDIAGAAIKKSHAPMEAWIQVSAARELARLGGQDFDALKMRARSPDFAPVTLSNVDFSTEYKVDTALTVSNNVLAILPGASRPHEYVFYTAHWDAHGISRPDASGDRIYNGAQDNASGVSMLLELARYFAKAPRPPRSMVFMALTAEEKGMLGSFYYASAPLYPLERTAAEFNMDGALGAGRARSISTLGDSQNSLQDMLSQLAVKNGRYLEPDPRPEAGLFLRSDHFPFALKGVPALSIAPGNDLINGGIPAGLAARRDYSINHYHQPSDEYKESLNFENMPDDARLLAELGMAVAKSPDWPQWKASSDFKAIRDRSSSRRASAVHR